MTKPFVIRRFMERLPIVSPKVSGQIWPASSRVGLADRHVGVLGRIWRFLDWEKARDLRACEIRIRRNKSCRHSDATRGGLEAFE